MSAEPIYMSEDEFNDVLNDCYEDVTICGYTMSQGDILRQCDPVAFRCALADEPPRAWECSECGTEYDNEEDAEECCEEDADE